MTDKPENPPPPMFAFPSRDASGYYYIAEGATLRDYFAAAALQGLVVLSKGSPDAFTIADGEIIKREDKICEEAYKIADAMLEARVK